MSRWPTESLEPTASPVLSGAWPRVMDRCWRRLRGRISRHVLYLQRSGVSSWEHTGTGPTRDKGATFDSFQSWAAAHPGTDAQLFLSGHLIHSLAIEPALNVRGDAAVRGYAQQQFTHYHGTAAMRWPLTAWSGSGGAGACAGHAIDLEALGAAARAHDIRLLGICPAWSAGLPSLGTAIPQFAGVGRHALLLTEGGLVTWLVADNGVVVTLQQRYLDTPNMAALNALSDDLVAQSAALVEPPLIVGWGLDDASAVGGTTGAVTPALGHAAMTNWMLDTVGSRA